VVRKLAIWLMRQVRSLRRYGQRKLREKAEYGNIKRKQALCQKVCLSQDEKAQIDSFFVKHYGEKIPYHWHRLYQSYTGTFCKDYFPEILFSTRLEPLLSKRGDAEFLGDKNLLEVLFCNVPGVRVPKTFGSGTRGMIRGKNKTICSREALAKELSAIGPCVIKKTVDTNSGRDVMLCDFQNGVDSHSEKTVLEILHSFGEDFVVQELVCQSEALAKINSTSVNTFRVISYFCDDALHVCPIALRVGRSGADKDNIHYGGISVGVKPDGALRKAAFSEFGEAFLAHPDSQIVFEEYKIPGAEHLANAAKQLHACVPWLKMISWDLTIDVNDRITLIEMNTVGQSAWFPQMVNGEPLFGRNTPSMLALIRKK